MMYWNTRAVMQSFYDPGGGPMIYVPAGWVYSSSLIPQIANHPAFSKFVGLPRTLSEMVDQRREVRVGVIRSYALGDVIMVLAVLRTVRKRFPQVTFDFYSQPRFAGLFAGDSPGFRFFPYTPGQIPTHYQLGFNLDGVLEKDHSVEAYSQRHRLLILTDYFGITHPASADCQHAGA